ncbi:MAG: DUF6077 domain-containing protein, partial [Lachnospiraceae bacterium]
NHFEPLVMTYGMCMILYAIVSAGVFLWRWYHHRGGGYFPLSGFGWKKEPQRKHRRLYSFVLWGIVFILIGFQCYQALFYQFHDGDDAVYAVTSVMTNTNHSMYVHLPYTGGTSALDKRHAFSSAPIFISFLARVCNIHPTIVTHTIFPIVVLLLLYMLYKLTADVLLEQQRAYVPLFLIFINIMNVFGNNTIYSNATFLLTRTAQGKAFQANLIPVAAVLCLLLIGKAQRTTSKQGAAAQKSGMAVWVLLACTMITAGYTSIMGIFLVVLLVGIGVLFLMIAERTLSLLVPFMLSMLPILGMGLIYLKVLLGG